jgi:hypothetical protein
MYIYIYTYTHTTLKPNPMIPINIMSAQIGELGT